jgi:4-amino-4-deoxy-L-arabinose transferase-like glycosyltransferase
LRFWVKSHNQIAIALIILLLFSFCLNTCGIWWGLPSFSGWAADELIPLRVLEGMEKGFSNGWHYKYPPVHFYILAVFYSPVWLLHKLNIIDIYSLPAYTFLFYIGRFLTVFMGSALLLIIYLCGLEIYDRKSSFFAVLITALSVPLIYYSKTINLEVPYLLWVMLSLLFYLKLLKHHRLKDYLLFALTAAIAVCTKDQAYAFYLLTPIFIIVEHHRYLKQDNPDITLKDSLTDKRIILSLAVGIGAFLLLQNIIFNLPGFLKHVKLITAGGGSIRPRYEQSIVGQLQMFRQTLTHLRFSLGCPTYIMCLLGFTSILYRLKNNYLLASLLVPTISYYLFYVCVVWYNNVRYLMPLAIILALCGGKFLGEFLNPEKNLFKGKAILVTALFIYTFAYGFSVNILMMQDSRYYVEQWMQQNIDKNALIVNTGGNKYSPRLDRFRSEDVDAPSLELLSTKKPEYVIVSSGYDIRRFEKNAPEYAFFDNLNKEINYKLVLKYQSQPKWNLFDRQELSYRDLDKMYIYSNIDKINPEITIFKRK